MQSWFGCFPLVVLDILKFLLDMWWSVFDLLHAMGEMTHKYCRPPMTFSQTDWSNLTKMVLLSIRTVRLSKINDYITTNIDEWRIERCMDDMETWRTNSEEEADNNPWQTIYQLVEAATGHWDQLPDPPNIVSPSHPNSFSCSRIKKHEKTHFMKDQMWKFKYE